MKLVADEFLTAARRMLAAVEAFAAAVERLATVEFGSLEEAVRVLESRVCVVCGEEFTRRDNEARQSFEKRQSCDKVECRYEIRRRNGRKGGLAPKSKPTGRRRMDVGPRTCVVCGVEFVRRAKETTTKFRKRDTCSRSCGRVKSARARRGVSPVAPPAPVGLPSPRPIGPPLPPKPVAPPVPVKAVDAVEPAQRWRPPPPPEPARMVDKGSVTYCEKHPSDTIGVYGCPACNAGREWARAERSRPMQPRLEGGR